MAAPVQLAAIDAGSNAIRLVIARATSPKHIEMLDCERAAVRLGHNAFTRRVISGDTISRAARAFRQFRDRMDQHNVGAYRAVATAAAREARLVWSAVQWALGDRIQPRLIFDLGGGSLELSFYQRGVLEQRIGLPLGTI